MALRLERRGITRVHPLDGGFPRWMALGFPVSGANPAASARGRDGPPVSGIRPGHLAPSRCAWKGTDERADAGSGPLRP